MKNNETRCISVHVNNIDFVCVCVGGFSLESLFMYLAIHNKCVNKSQGKLNYLFSDIGLPLSCRVL